MIDKIRFKYLKAKLKEYNIEVPSDKEVVVIFEETIKPRQARRYVRAIKDDIEKQKELEVLNNNKFRVSIGGGVKTPLPICTPKKIKQ